MANREVVESMMTHLAEVCERNFTEKKVEAYLYAFRNYTDKQISEAGFKMLEDIKAGSKFPGPKDIIERVPRHISDGNKDFIIYEEARCKGCGDLTRCIREPKNSENMECADCYSGLTFEQRREKFNEIIQIMDSKKMESSAWAEAEQKQKLLEQKSLLGGW
jgi:hypothetical protein